jgi:hypothetical protein
LALQNAIKNKAAELPILAVRPLLSKPLTFRPNFTIGLAFSEYRIYILLEIFTFYKLLKDFTTK